LPGRTDEDFGHRLLEAEVRVGDDQAHSAQPSTDELAQKLKPELRVMSRELV
jgi:hypothetical protein